MKIVWAPNWRSLRVFVGASATSGVFVAICLRGAQFTGVNTAALDVAVSCSVVAMLVLIASVWASGKQFSTDFLMLISVLMLGELVTGMRGPFEMLLPGANAYFLIRLLDDELTIDAADAVQLGTMPYAAAIILLIVTRP